MAAYLLIEAFKVLHHEGVALLGQRASAVGEQAISDLQQLHMILVDWSMFVAGVRRLLVGGRDLGPETLALVAAKSKGSGNADGANGVQLVGVVEDLGLNGLGRRAGAEAMGGDGVGDRLDFGSWLSVQYGTRHLGTGLSVVVREAVAVAAGDVVKQGGGADYFQVGALDAG